MALKTHLPDMDHHRTLAHLHPWKHGKDPRCVPSHGSLCSGGLQYQSRLDLEPYLLQTQTTFAVCFTARLSSPSITLFIGITWVRTGQTFIPPVVKNLHLKMHLHFFLLPVCVICFYYLLIYSISFYCMYGVCMFLCVDGFFSFARQYIAVRQA